GAVPRRQAGERQGARFGAAQERHPGERAASMRTMTMTRSGRPFLAALSLAALAVPAWAHHSYSMFDMDKTVVLEASVVRFKWQNPHAFIEADVAAKGGTERWSIEMTSPNN